MYKGTVSAYIQSCHVVCLGISNKSVAVPRQDSICLCRVHNIIYCHDNCDEYIIFLILTERFVKDLVWVILVLASRL